MQKTQVMLSSGQKRPVYSQEQQLEDLYEFFDKKTGKKIKQTQINPFNQQNLYQGCQYDPNQFYAHQNQEIGSYENQNPYSQSQAQTQKYRNLNFGPKQQKNDYVNSYSQPTSFNSNFSSFQNKCDDKLKRMRQPDSSNSNKSSNLQPSRNRSLNALVSASKPKYKSKKTISQKQSSNSSRSNYQSRKLTNNDDKNEPIFLNPLNSFPSQLMDLTMFQKAYKMKHVEIFEKMDEIYKKINILGQKAYFKDNSNEQRLDEVFKLLGVKQVSKLGKGKSVREFKAIFKYMNMNNPQTQRSKQAHLGQAAQHIESFYLAQFKQLMGYKESSQVSNQSSKKNLFGFGFQKL